jgi:osmotically-inducible protein OsmY
MVGRAIILTTSLCTLALVATACDKSDPPVVQSRQDAQGNTHIDINNNQIKKDLSQAGDKIKQGATNLASEVKTSASEISASDTAISARVKTRLTTTPDLGGFHISVEVADGHVTLRGKVRSADRKADAGKIAERTQGVKSVDNQLEVDPSN